MKVSIGQTRLGAELSRAQTRSPHDDLQHEPKVVVWGAEVCGVRRPQIPRLRRYARSRIALTLGVAECEGT